MKFFPFVFSLFMFILTANLIGMFPYTFTVTSHLIVTVALALMVFHRARLRPLQKRLGFFKLFVPHGIPDLHPAAGYGDRGDLVPVPPGVAFGSSVRQHAGRPHHAEGFRRLRDLAWSALGALGIFGSVLPLAMTTALTASGTAGRLPAGLCVHDPDLHLSQRRTSSGPLTAF
jgi:F-type H+-transporting ATPase subunit a